ncbi:MAG: TraR/DksA family transcriptional regulator [Gammaproteobacteria bacterium]|nr:TraR/DksA family transcriptional regulator [Gammaproteobacteria bacterium]
MVTDGAVRERLLARRAELQARAQRVRADLQRQNEALSPDFAEQATQRENDDVLGAIELSAKEELEQISRAILRLDRGEYGYCTRCGAEIDAERLEAVPHAERCAACARAARR